jgi:tetratricopeptide (TPR) repeat protein
MTGCGCPVGGYREQGSANYQLNLRRRSSGRRSIVTQEFYISVTPVRDGEYLIRTERVALGVPLAEELLTWDVDRWLGQAAQVMHDPLIGLLRGTRTGTATTPIEPESCDLVALGRDLYDAIFQGTIRDSWMIAQGVAQNQNEILRLRLGLKDDVLPMLPWEVMNDGARPIATNTDVVFSRYRSTSTRLPNPSDWHRAAGDDRPLQILMVLAAPTDQEMLQLHQEAQELQQELQRSTPANEPPNLALTILDQPGREQLTAALEQGHYDILHYAGHSNLSASGGDLYLVSSKTGLTEVLSGDDLAGLLVNNGVRMAVFNSCQGFYGATATENGGSGGNLADALLKRNIPAVVAMAEPIPDDVALNFSRLFYRNLKQRCPIDLSLSRARQGLLSSYGSDQLYWAIPILYMHAEFEGYLQGHQSTALDPYDVDWDTGPQDWEPEDLPPQSWEPVGATAQQDQQTIKQLLGELDSTKVAPQLDLELPDPANDAIDFHRLGRQLAAQGDIAGALEAYGNAINLDPEFADAYNDLGKAFELDGGYSEAMTSYKMALRYAPQHPEAEQNLKRLATDILAPATGLIAATEPTGQREPAPVTRGASATDRLYAPTVGSESNKSAKQSAKGFNRKTIAMTGATIAVLASLWALAGRQQMTAPPIPTAQTATTEKNRETLATATQSFAQQDLRQGTEAVAQLLETGDLVAAESALNAVPSKNVGAPVVSYLRGRLAWENIRRQPTSYSYTDARRNWATAVKEQPNNLHYRTTLGFGYYAERNWDEANRVWQEARNQSPGNDKDNEPERLTATAGQALALMKQAKQGGQKPDARKVNEAKTLRDRVIKANPAAFQAQNLIKDWRWTEQMVADWANLMAEK